MQFSLPKITSFMVLTVALAACGGPAKVPDKLEKQHFEAAQAQVIAAYPAPFEETFKQVVAKIGSPKKTGGNMNEWFAKDGDKCIAFFMTKDGGKGHAAAGIMDSEPANCP
jgi:hypothetical protein